jgi:hypothetical protein
VTPQDDERIAYLTGEDRGSLQPQERAELDELRHLLAAPAIWEQPSETLEDSIVTAISEETQLRNRTAAAQPGRRRRRLAMPRPLLGGIALAAAAVIAIVVVLGTRSGAPAQQQFAMIVEGTPLAPGAHGSATLTKTGSGWQIRLSVTGLTRRSGGLYYEAWLKNRAGILVPVGTFNDARHVTLWSGVPVTQFRTLTVTEQRVGGGPASSGVRALVGSIVPKH